LRRAAAASQLQPQKPGSTPAAKPAEGAKPAPNPQGGEEKGDEQDMLEQFLLDNL